MKLLAIFGVITLLIRVIGCESAVSSKEKYVVADDLVDRDGETGVGGADEEDDDRVVLEHSDGLDEVQRQDQVHRAHEHDDAEQDGDSSRS